MIYIRRSRRTIAVAGLIVACTALAVAVVVRGNSGPPNRDNAAGAPIPASGIPIEAAIKKAGFPNIAAKGCDCAKGNAAATAWGGKGGKALKRQTPVMTCTDTTIIQAGSVVHFVDGSGNSFTGSGVWSATLGLIGSDGTYTAPATIPNDGMDQIIYTNPTTGTVSTFQVVIVANHGAPISPQASTFEPVSFSPLPVATATPSTSALSLNSTSSTTTSPVPFSYDAPTDQPTISTFDTPPDTSSATAITATTLASGSIGYLVPVTDPSLPTIYAVPDPSVVLTAFCKKHPVLPTPPWAGKPCTGSGTATVVGQPNVYPHDRKEVGPTTVKVDAGIQATIWKVLGIKLDIGASFSCFYWTIQLTETQNTDYYVCKNGVWTYDHSRQCVAYGTEETGFNPSWYRILCGFSADPSVQWGNWWCHTL